MSVSSDRRSATDWLRALVLVAFVVACMAHLWGLYSPRVELPTDAPNSDKWAHLIGFGLPVALGWLRFRRGRVWIVALFASHAVISELIQHWILPGRTGDPSDAVADLVGVVLGVVLGWLTASLWQRARRLSSSTTLRTSAQHDS